ncbi:hypothetical protein [Novilysobacter erysipheiresistens]|uniref:Uncharacterized protein n=1 Tax=Novilysobacter erysipheiresistens TaxID=1749332 RepID=A0ABU7YZA0_9GAMM
MRHDQQNQKPGQKEPGQDQTRSQQAGAKDRQKEQPKPATGQRQQDTNKTPRQH